MLGCGCYRVTTRLTQGWSSLGDCFDYDGHPVDIGSQLENDIILEHVSEWQKVAGDCHINYTLSSVMVSVQEYRTIPFFYF